MGLYRTLHGSGESKLTRHALDAYVYVTR